MTSDVFVNHDDFWNQVIFYAVGLWQRLFTHSDRSLSYLPFCVKCKKKYIHYFR